MDLSWIFDGIGTELIKFLLASIVGGVIGYKIGAKSNSKQKQVAGTEAEQNQELVIDLHNIYKMCLDNSQYKQVILDNFAKKINEYSSLKIIKEWWNNIPCALQITAVGKVLAHSNAKRIDDTLPNMD